MQTATASLTREEALEIAKVNREAHRKHDREDIKQQAAMGKAGDPTFDALALYGFRHGWYQVGEFSFSDEEVGGYRYDITQSGWAHL